MTSHTRRHTISHLLETLHASFGNITNMSPETLAFLETIGINSRIIAAIRTELRAAYCGGDCFKDNPNGLARYQDRVKWRDKVLTLLHIEMSNHVVAEPDDVEDKDFLQPYTAYLKFYPGPYYLRLDEELFARLIGTIAQSKQI